MTGQGNLLSDIFTPSLSLDSKSNTSERAMSLWEEMARNLDEIAANTRHGVSKKTVTALSGQEASVRTGKRSNREDLPQRSEKVSPGRRDKTRSTHSILATPDHEGKRAEPHKLPTPPRPTPAKSTSVIAQSTSASPGSSADSSGAQVTSDRQLLPKPHPVKEHVEASETEKTKSQESLARAQNQADAKTQASTIADTLKQNLAQWDGSVIGAHGDAQEAVGLAAGGPVYAAIQEVSGALESKDQDEGSLLGAFRKTLEDKTGITAVKEKASDAKEGIKSRIQSWAGNNEFETGKTKKGKRDKKGRFIRPAASAIEKKQTVLATQSYDLAQRESKDSKKRHQELIRAVRIIDGGGRGLLDNALDRWGGRDRRARGKGRDRQHRRDTDTRGRSGRSASSKPRGRLARAGSRLGGLGTKALGIGAGMLGAGALLGETGLVETVASTVATRSTASTSSHATGKGAGQLGKAGAKAGALGAKGLGAAARAIPVAGQILAAGMAIYDGVQGWNDSEMHHAAFGLEEGEEATSGQKASAAAANVLDMGGLLTGIAEFAGFDVDTADIASGIYSAGSTVTDTVVEAWDGVSSGISSAWSGLMNVFSDDKADAQQVSEHTEGSDTRVVQAGSTSPIAPLLSIKKQEALHTADRQNKDDSELGMDAVIVPDEKMGSLFGSLATAVAELGETIKSEIKRKEMEDGGIFSSVSGFVSGITSWFSNKASATNGGVSERSTGGKSTRYTYDPNAKIGEAVAQYESGDGGSSTIGFDGNGGTSYGKYQLSSRAGGMEGFLKMMEGKGGEHAAIAARLRASGPANTGNEQGAMPTQWKQEASANGELLKSAEHEYMLQANYAPAMQGLEDGLRGKVESSKALQEAMFSTSVQHGPGRTSGIWNKVYQDGMSEEDLIRAVYSERATRFGSSTPQVQASVKQRMANEQEMILSMRRGESSANSVAAAVQNSPQDQAMQTAASTVVQASTQDAEGRGIGYLFGSKNSQRGGIDCSGWIAEINKSLMESMNAAMGQDVYGSEAKQVLAKGANGGAAGIIQAVSEATGQQLGNADLSPDKIREGMMIGMDTGQKGWDAGRYKGIDHIVQTYKDQVTGEMMVSESTSGGKNGKGGVRSTPYAEWFEKWGKKAKLYGTDVTQLADASKIGVPLQATSAIAENTKQTAAPSSPLAQAQPAVSANATTPVAFATPDPRPTSVESVGDIAPPKNIGTNTMQTANMEKILQSILAILTQQSKSSHTPNGSETPPYINMDFDDQASLRLAHDQA